MISARYLSRKPTPKNSAIDADPRQCVAAGEPRPQRIGRPRGGRTRRGGDGSRRAAASRSRGISSAAVASSSVPSGVRVNRGGSGVGLALRRCRRLDLGRRLRWRHRRRRRGADSCRTSSRGAAGASVTRGSAGGETRASHARSRSSRRSMSAEPALERRLAGDARRTRAAAVREGRRADRGRALRRALARLRPRAPREHHDEPDEGACDAARPSERQARRR